MSANTGRDRTEAFSEMVRHQNIYYNTAINDMNNQLDVLAESIELCDMRLGDIPGFGMSLTELANDVSANRKTIGDKSVDALFKRIDQVEIKLVRVLNNFDKTCTCKLK